LLKVYCDTGGYAKELRLLVKEGLVELCQFKYENRSKIQSGAVPSDLRYSNRAQYTYDDLRADRFLSNVTGDDVRSALRASKFQEISAIVGPQKRVDAQHLDSAYMSNCRVFLTSDFDDIASKRGELGPLLWLNIFLVVPEWEKFLAFVHSQ